MELQGFLEHVNRGALIEGGSEAHRFMHDVIGRMVWLGASVTVVPGVTIGDGAIAGVPAKLIRMTGLRRLPG
jgi:acetyltransferase-like isoleucine patch superfamily enzyme